MPERASENKQSFRRQSRWCRLALVTLVASGACSASVQGQLRVVSYNSAHLAGDANAFQDVLEELADDDRPGFAVAPGLLVFQEVRSFNFAQLQALVTAAAPPGVSYAAATYTNSGNEDDAAGAQAMFYHTDLLEEIPSGHRDIFTGASRFADRWQLQLVGYDSPDAGFYLYSAHLKASQGDSNEAQRLAGVEALRDDAATLPAGAHVIYAGDMNFYHNNEPGYLKFLLDGTGQAFDPLGPGSWGGSSNAIKHTQSPRLTSLGDLVGGGLDDRFDFQLPTAPWFDDDGLSLIQGTYRSVGNDGLHYNDDINDGNNFYYPGDLPRSNALADDLHVASDHLPLAADYQVPAVMFADLPENFGRAIRDAEIEVDLLVMNTAEVETEVGADVLDFDATGLAGLMGSGSGSVEPLGDFAVIPFAVDTAEVGEIDGGVLVTSDNEGVQNDTIIASTTGTVLRPSNPSFDEVVDTDDTLIVLTLPADTGVQTIDVDVFNFGFNSLQALLDLDDVTGADDPFMFLGDLETGIGPDPVTLSFGIDTDGLSEGDYLAMITIETSDEDVPGETMAALTLDLVVTIEGGKSVPGDLNGDGVVDAADLALLLGSWGPCAGCPADLDGNGEVNAADLAILLGAWT